MEEKFCLGISFGFNSSASIVSNKRGVLCAVSQERMNGKKNTKEVPFDAIRACMEIAKSKGVSRIDKVAYSHYQKLTVKELMEKSPEMYDEIGREKFFIESSSVECALMGIVEAASKHGEILKVDVKPESVSRVMHHVAHAYAPIAFYGMDKEFYVVTSDGFGDGISGTIAHFEMNKFVDVVCDSDVISVAQLESSVALVYQFVTGALGFKEHQHEGKITGLAAYGDESVTKQKFYGMFKKCCWPGNRIRFDFKDNLDKLSVLERKMVSESTIVGFDKFLVMKKMVYKEVESMLRNGVRREDIAAGVQAFAEEVTVNWISSTVMKRGLPGYLSGGLFANVKLNQKIAESGVFSEVRVCPPMGDEGTCAGAALYALVEGYGGSQVFYGKDAESQKAVYDRVCSGTKASAGGNMCVVEVVNAIDSSEKRAKDFCVWKQNSEEQKAKQVAKILADKRIVCLMEGNMEFGPRALCKRSILYNCDKKGTNDWLNKRLSRTEFMPFAPVCREEDAERFFENVKSGWDSAHFMTITFKCTEEFKENYPAAVHVDGTARPQFVSKESNRFMWMVLTEYEKLTGKAALINTSFNLHNNPIIEDVGVAVESMAKSDLNVIVVDDAIVAFA